MSIRSFLAGVAVSATVALSAVSAQALPFLTGQLNTPDFVVNGVSASYAGSSLNANSLPVPIVYEQTPGNFINFTQGTISIQAAIQPDGTVGSGTLEIDETNGPTFVDRLLEGTLKAVGASGTTLQLLWEVTGGTYASDFGGVGGEAMTLLAGTGYTGGATINNFNTFFSATTDTTGVEAQVPVPAALPLMVAGIGALAFATRRKR